MLPDQAVGNCRIEPQILHDFVINTLSLSLERIEFVVGKCVEAITMVSKSLC